MHGNHSAHAGRYRAYCLGALLALGCSADVVEPRDKMVRPAFTTSESGFVVTEVQLRPAVGSSSTMWGVLTVFTGVEHPPNPICEHGALDATVAVCGVIHNLDRESLEGGDFTATFGRTGQQIVLRFAVPPNPICETYLVRAASSIPLVEINPGPPTVDVSFRTSVGSIVGVNPGPPTQNPGPPQTETQPGPPTDPGQNPGPPNCQVTFAGE